MHWRLSACRLSRIPHAAIDRTAYVQLGQLAVVHLLSSEDLAAGPRLLEHVLLLADLESIVADLADELTDLLAVPETAERQWLGLTAGSDHTLHHTCSCCTEPILWHSSLPACSASQDS